jgi:glutathione S-transferase
MLTLFHAPGTCARASLIALEEAGATYTPRRIDFGAAEQQGADYLAINPKGRVPALVTDAGILTETPAILAYIAQTHPRAGLAPLDDPFAFARLQAFNSYLCSTVHVAHAHRVRGYRWADDPAAIAEMARKTPEVMAACMALIEADLAEDAWVMGERYTVADAYLFTIACWLEGDSVDLARLPKVHAHRERVRARPATQRALAAERA